MFGGAKKSEKNPSHGCLAFNATVLFPRQNAARRRDRDIHTPAGASPASPAAPALPANLSQSHKCSITPLSSGCRTGDLLAAVLEDLSPGVGELADDEGNLLGAKLALTAQTLQLLGGHVAVKMLLARTPVKNLLTRRVFSGAINIGLVSINLRVMVPVGRPHPWLRQVLAAVEALHDPSGRNTRTGTEHRCC